MTRRLFILRHAKSDWDAEAPDDFERPLARRGLKVAPRMGLWMKAQGLIPDLVLSSPAQRARQTTTAVANALGIAKDRIRYEDRLYLADCGTLMQVLRECPGDAQRILIVGHNPGLDELVEYLAGGPVPRTEKGKLLTTAAVAEFETERSWRGLEGGQAKLKQLVRPSEFKNDRKGEEKKHR